MKISEGNLVFSFDSEYTAIKFDDRPFYREYFNNMPGGKGVDIIADSDDIIHLIEIKIVLDMNRKTAGEPVPVIESWIGTSGLRCREQG